MDWFDKLTTLGMDIYKTEKGLYQGVTTHAVEVDRQDLNTAPAEVKLLTQEPVVIANPQQPGSASIIPGIDNKWLFIGGGLLVTGMMFLTLIVRR